MKKKAREFIATMKEKNQRAAARAKRKIRSAIKEGQSVNRILRKLEK